MRIEITVSGPDGPHDVAVLASAPVRLGEVREELAAAVGLGPRSPLFAADREVTSETWVGGPGLRSGGELSGTPAGSRRAAAVAVLRVVGGASAGGSMPLERGRLIIGRSPECDLVLDDDRVSRRHCAVEVGPSSVSIRDLGSANGTVLGSVAVGCDGATLAPGQLIEIGDSLLEVHRGDDAAAATTCTDDAVLVNRAPRRPHAARAAEITLAHLGEPATPRPVQWVFVLLPAVAGAGAAWFLHSWQFLLFALMSPVMLASGALSERLHARRTGRARRSVVTAALAEQARELAAGLDAEITARRSDSPDPAALAGIAADPGIRIWERRRGDADFLRIRVGSTHLPSLLRIRDGSSSRPGGVVRAVPLCVDLGEGPLGLAGPAVVAAGLARWLVVQLAVLHSPADVGIVLLIGPDRAPAWEWARWLPHLAGRVATSPAEWPDLLLELESIMTQRRSTPHPVDELWLGTWFVVVVDPAAILTGVNGGSALSGVGTAVGVSAVFIDSDHGALPPSCTSLATITGETGTRVAVRRSSPADPGEALLDRVGIPYAEQVARALAPLVDGGADPGELLPDRCRLLDLLALPDPQPSAIIDRWACSSGRADTVLGVAHDGPAHIDLERDGPHALVAGTTGAGKSALLQCLVVGLAASHPPEELTFLLVDYKGGAAFADCAGLPHVAGSVTDLDATLTARALRSLDAELRRRENAFAAAGAPDLQAYRTSGPTMHLARLVIVVDEFAALSEELPEFVRGLLSVAQRGRSLGVHLVLATQRPGSVVSADIRANTSLRIALRVTDRAESIDVIDAPDAAAISRTRPGRGYLRTGSELRCFQTAQVSGSRAGSTKPAVEMLGRWRRPLPASPPVCAPDDLAVLCAAIAAAAAGSGRPTVSSPWHPPLDPTIALSSLDPESVARVPLGRVDLPAVQSQPNLVLDLAVGTGVLTVGAGGTGRTTALATIALSAARRLAPAELELYVVDPAGELAASLAVLPHIATCVGPGDLALTAALLHRLARADGERTGGDTGAHRLLLVDGWDRLIADLDDTSAAWCTEQLHGVLRSPAVVTTVVSGDRTLLGPRFAGGFATKLLLHLPERGDYALAGVAAREVPVAMSPGRCVRAPDGAQVQLAHPGATPTDHELRREVAATALRWDGYAPSQDAIRLRTLPVTVSLRDITPESSRIRLGVGGESRAPVTIDLFAGAGRLLVAGPPRSGRTTALTTLLTEAGRLGIRTVVAAPGRSPLAAHARSTGAQLVRPDGPSDLASRPPAEPTLLLVDDSEAFVDSAVGDVLVSWSRTVDAPLACAVAGRCDDLAGTYRGVAAQIRRNRCGLLLRPGPIDGELLGIRLPRRPGTDPPGRGVLVGEPGWGPLFTNGSPVPIQVALPDPHVEVLTC